MNKTKRKKKKKNEMPVIEKYVIVIREKSNTTVSQPEVATSQTATKV